VNPVRERRLRSDYTAARAVCMASRQRIVLEECLGDPPEAYHFVYHCLGVARMEGNTPVYAEQHRVFVQFPAQYPAQAPLLRILSPAVHPHVWANGVVCLGAWRPTEKLDSLLQRVGDILTYAPAALNWRSVANDEAAAWARQNLDLFPLDQPLFTAIPTQMLYL
jgi:ubiquitin-protein ligase